MSTTILTARTLTREVTAVLGKTNRVSIPLFTKNDLVIQISVVDEDGDAVDISGYTTRNFGVYPPASGTADFTGTPALVGGGTGGIMTVTITDANTSAFTAGNKRLEVQISNGSLKHTILTGTLVFELAQQ